MTCTDGLGLFCRECVRVQCRCISGDWSSLCGFGRPAAADTPLHHHHQARWWERLSEYGALEELWDSEFELELKGTEPSLVGTLQRITPVLEEHQWRKSPRNKLTQLVEACFGLVLACGELHKYLDVSEIFPAVNNNNKSFSDLKLLNVTIWS